MAQVTDQTGLQAALSARDPQIQIAADFSLSTQIAVTYPVIISSLSPDTVYTITKASDYYSYLIRVSGGGALTLQNLIIDGDRSGHAVEDITNRSLIFVADGALTVGDGVILRNNYAYQEGGGIYISGSTAYTNTLTIEGNAKITGCTSRTSGGGVMVALRNSGDRVSITGDAELSGNSAANGGGLYYRSYQEGVGGPFTLGGNVKIIGNTASSRGGGLYISSYVTGSSPALPVMLTGAVQIEGNQAVHGGGVYYYGANTGDGIFIEDGVQLISNQASGNGGGLHVTAVSGTVAVHLSGADCLIRDNEAENGGGAFLNSSVGIDLRMDGISLKENRTVVGSGGGLWFGSSSSSSQPFTVQLTETTIQKNSAARHGGGIYYQSGSNSLHFVMSGSQVESNTASQSGGGVLFNATGDVTFTGCVIDQNISGQYGGGIYNIAGSRVQLSGTSLYGNQAVIGGAVYNQNNAVICLCGDTIIGRPLPNTATRYAPGIYNGAVLETADQPDAADGLYLVSRSSAARIVRAMEPEAALLLDNGGYVRPNPEGTPIVVAEASDGYPVLRQQDADAFLKPVTGFDGWEIRLSGDQTQILLAPTHYTITYEKLMGAMNPNPDSYTVVADTIQLAPPSPLPGYRFRGWLDEEGNPVTEIPRGSTGNLTLAASWEEIWHTVVYRPNAAESSPARWIPSPTAVWDGRDVRLFPLIPERDGSVFMEWNTDVDGMGTAYQPGGTVEIVLADLELYAQWGFRVTDA